MALVDNQTRLCDLVLKDPNIITVYNRFGIKLGVEDKSISNVCSELGLDSAFFATILNVYLNEEYFPERILSTFSATTIIGYLKKTNKYYVNYQLPNIERHFNLLIAKSNTSNCNLPLIKDFFNEVKCELLSRIDEDENHWFPEIINKEIEVGYTADTDMGINHFTHDNDTVEDKIDDLINMFIIHLKGDYDLNLCHAVVFAVFSLKKEISKNNRIRNRLLLPISRLMSQSK